MFVRHFCLPKNLERYKLHFDSIVYVTTLQTTCQARIFSNHFRSLVSCKVVITTQILTWELVFRWSSIAHCNQTNIYSFLLKVASHSKWKFKLQQRGWSSQGTVYFWNFACTSILNFCAKIQNWSACKNFELSNVPWG